jgi:hypothetical protein
VEYLYRLGVCWLQCGDCVAWRYNYTGLQIIVHTNYVLLQGVTSRIFGLIDCGRFKGNRNIAGHNAATFCVRMESKCDCHARAHTQNIVTIFPNQGQLYLVQLFE